MRRLQRDMQRRPGDCAVVCPEARDLALVTDAVQRNPTQSINGTPRGSASCEATTRSEAGLEPVCSDERSASRSSLWR